MNIYIHIPFCKQKCTYCKFAITPVFDDYKKKKYLHFLENEIKNTLELFHIISIYQKHKDLILELIQKSQIYTESYIDELLQNYQGKVFNNREDLLRLIIGVYVDEKDINKRPLSKLLIDISKSLGLLY